MNKFQILKTLYINSQKIFNTVLSIASVLFLSSFFAARSLKKLRKENSNDTCYILGNGPSLASELKENIESFRNNDVFVVNTMCKSPLFKVIKPKYYILLDPICFDPEWSEYAVVIDSLLDTDWQMIIFLPKSLCPEKYYSKLKKNQNLKIVFFNETRIVGISNVSFYLYKNWLGLPNSRNVMTQAIMSAINIGYKRIYLYGADHSWTRDLDADQNNRIFIRDKHFYEEDVKRYLPVGMYREYLYQHYLTFLSHSIMNRYAKYRGSKVINKTRHSFIEDYDTEE